MDPIDKSPEQRDKNFWPLEMHSMAAHANDGNLSPCLSYVQTRFTIHIVLNSFSMFRTEVFLRCYSIRSAVDLCSHPMGQADKFGVLGAGNKKSRRLQLTEPVP